MRCQWAGDLALIGSKPLEQSLELLERIRASGEDAATTNVMVEERRQERRLCALLKWRTCATTVSIQKNFPTTSCGVAMTGISKSNALSSNEPLRKSRDRKCAIACQ